MKKHVIIRMAVMLFIVSCVTFSSGIKVNALDKQVFITIKVNGSCIAIDPEALPYVKNDRTYVPVRFVAEALGAKVDWVGEEKKVIITSEETAIEMFQLSSEMYVNGEKKLMDAEVEILGGRTMVPVRFAAEELGYTVEWDESTYSVIINKEGAAVPAASIHNRPYTDDDIIWLARIITVEGRGLSIDGKVAIANVVLNRVKSPRFPDTIYDVIFDAEYSVQFPPAHKDSFRELKASGDCVVAAKMALEGINNIDSCLFFNNVPFKGKADDLFTIIDGEYFYY
jgi:N-acetylmuramoyl-L-alanine amidase